MESITTEITSSIVSEATIDSTIAGESPEAVFGAYVNIVLILALVFGLLLLMSWYGKKKQSKEPKELLTPEEQQKIEEEYAKNFEETFSVFSSGKSKENYRKTQQKHDSTALSENLSDVPKQKNEEDENKPESESEQ